SLPSQWQVEYSGGESNTNRQTIQIIVTAVNFQCSDTGLYKCRATLPTNETAFSYPVNITAKAPINHSNITMTPHIGKDPYSSTHIYGENITLTCAASGPSSLQISWNYTVVNRTGEDIPSFHVSNFTPASDAAASWSTCSTITFTSDLVVQLQEPGDSITYYCIVSDNGVEQSRRNVTIHIVLSSTTTIHNMSSSTTTTNISTTTLSTNHNAGTCNTMRPMKMICFLTCVSVIMRFSILSFNYW
ncbi:hypothetical protein BgiMline_015299, partial [Biomphalaria glabrata]